MHILELSDKERYEYLSEELKNASYVGRDEYPKTVTSAFKVMVRASGGYQHIGGCEGGRSGGIKQIKMWLW